LADARLLARLDQNYRLFQASIAYELVNLSKGSQRQVSDPEMAGILCQRHGSLFNLWLQPHVFDIAGRCGLTSMLCNFGLGL